MEEFIINIVSNHGVAGCLVLTLYFILKLIIADVNKKILNQKESLEKHIMMHKEWEKTLCSKIDKLYDRINPMCDALNKIQGYMEGKK